MTDVEMEYGFIAPIADAEGLMYVTTNPLLAETMQKARPEAQMFQRPSLPWEPVAREDGTR